mmetsp:Transcript_97653/g.304231  ORF Transcript_97653/g.304231 Transcript_97653/m.304231 type:complete len:84 (-) Transcript_97653:215-466(-)
MDNVRKAVALGQTLLIFFFEGEVGEGVPEPDVVPYAAHKPDVGLGTSQKGEVAWLRKRGIPFESRDMHDWERFAHTEMEITKQ